MWIVVFAVIQMFLSMVSLLTAVARVPFSTPPPPPPLPPVLAHFQAVPMLLKNHFVNAPAAATVLM